jgi:hypothetical protein
LRLPINLALQGSGDRVVTGRAPPSITRNRFAALWHDSGRSARAAASSDAGADDQFQPYQCVSRCKDSMVAASAPRSTRARRSAVHRWPGACCRRRAAAVAARPQTKSRAAVITSFSVLLDWASCLPGARPPFHERINLHGLPAWRVFSAALFYEGAPVCPRDHTKGIGAHCGRPPQ